MHCLQLLLSSLLPLSLASSLSLLHASLSPETLDLSTAHNIMKDMSEYEVNIPIYGDRPLLHHLLNLYLMSKSPSERSSLVNLMYVLISKKIEINAPYNNDPDVVFKAVLIRELGLAYAMTGGGGLTNNSLSLTQLYSLPCDPIPLSKLLLHAHSVVQDRKAHAEQLGLSFDIENVKSLLAGASLGVGAKPAAKAVDLYTHSSSFMGLLEKILLSDSKNLSEEGFGLQTIINSLGELGSAVHSRLLQNYLNESSSLLDGLSHLTVLLATFDKQGRNPLHTLALSGSASLVNDLVEVYAILNEKTTKMATRVRGQLGIALNAVDIRGHTPIAYAALRYGPKGEVYHSFRKLADIAKIEVNEIMVEYMFSSHLKKRKSEESMSSDEEHRQNWESDGGGWSTMTLDENLRGDPMHCDILEVWSGAPNAIDFFHYYLSLGKPVVFRNAMQQLEASGEHSIRKVLNKTSFLKKYGREVMPVSTIPYASSFGVNAKAKTLKDVANMAEVLQAQTEEQDVSAASGDAIVGKSGESDDVPLYAFNTAQPAWRDKIEDDIGLPPLIDGLIRDTEMQFYLGQAGTGAPMHYHGHAVNSLAYGEKKWFLLPPPHAVYSKVPSLQYARALMEKQNEGFMAEMMQCTQRAGDLMYVPTLWGHATLNTKQCIGVAHEFSVDDICME